MLFLDEIGCILSKYALNLSKYALNCVILWLFCHNFYDFLDFLIDV